MDIIKYKKIENNSIKKKLRVAAYARVSTNHDDQINSFESQKLYFSRKIEKNPDWIFAGIYADEGISGTSLTKRNGFKTMVKDALNNKIDLILTKSISRFARNTMDALMYIRELKSNGIGVYFEEENINTLSVNGEFLITVLSSVAQQEVETLSLHVRKGHTMLLKQGNVLFGAGCYGYVFDHENKKIIIDNDKSKIVKKIFKMFLNGKSRGEIKKYLEKKQIKSPTGLDTWDITTIKYILTNEKYLGILLQRKRCKLTPFTHSVKNKGYMEKYKIDDYHESIISKEDFDKVQKMLEEENYASCYNINLFSFKIKCGFCGSSLNKTRVKRGKTFMVCTNRRYNSREACPNSKDICTNIISNIVPRMLILSKDTILNNDYDNLLYVRNILRTTKLPEEFDQEYYNQIVKYIIVGGYNNYGKPLPYMIRIILYNEYQFNNKELKKYKEINLENFKTKIINEKWLSQNIVCYNNENGKITRQDITKIKVTLEIE